MRNWVTDRFDRFIQLKRGHDLPNQVRKNGSVEVISSSGVTAFHDSYISNTPGVITGRYGTIGEVFYTEKPYWPLNTTLYVVDFKKNIPKFVYYFLKAFDFEKFNDKSAVPGINRNHIHEELITFPLDSKEQQSIAEVLSSLDDKIDLLHRQNKTLEQMAETLFKQWFVEEAKEDWEVKKVGEVFETSGGGTPSTSEPEYWDGDICWTSPRDLSNNKNLFLNNTERKITQKGLSKISSGILPIGTVLMSSRAPIGYLAITDTPLAINQGYIACIPNQEISAWYIHCWIKSNMDLIISSANGSTFLEIPKREFRLLDFVVPPISKRREFDFHAEELYKKTRLNEQQIRKLEVSRDMLLPKLMNGAIKI